MTTPDSDTPLPRIVGLGASAGGLTALEAFFVHVRPDSGMAYIVVQHLDPTQKALLPQLLQRVTAMPVREAEHGMQVSADCVYVIPPNAELTLADNTLKLAAPVQPRGMRLPINVLFSSLASVLGDRAIGIVLSGMGADGTLGMQAIKAVGGLTLAQQPETAQFDAMPRSVIEAGFADIIAPADSLASRIEAYVGRVAEPAPHPGDGAALTAAPPPLSRIVRLLLKRTRHDFSLYKSSTLHRRIERRQAIHGIDSLARYADFLEQNPQEIDLLFKELLIGVTSFFRDPEVWDYLVTSALPALIERRDPSRPLRAWVAGCSTGEEAYSLAMALREAAESIPGSRRLDIQIFASDLSPDAITTARRGEYALSIADTIPAARLQRFFSRHDTHFQVNTEIRELILFAQHDVVLDPPFTKLDLLACRNLLIYFDATLQRRLIPLFHYCLQPDGLLVLGSSETVGRQTHLFDPVQSALRIYARRKTPATEGPAFLLDAFPPLSRLRKEHAVSMPNLPPDKTDNLQSAADHVLLQVYAPAAVVLNSDGDIVYISGRTGKYLEPAAGKANWNIHAMARPGLRAPLAQALKQASTQSEPVHLHGLALTDKDNGLTLDITVQVFHEPAALQGMSMVVFREMPREFSVQQRKGRRSTVAAAHAAELAQYQDEIIALREETRASKDALQSSNEELQSTNEELQSTNEELTTSKEEMQSMNEELQTINSELRAKLDDLALAQSDMQNVLNSIDIAILFLDQQLNVRRYTDRASAIVSLRESDIGRPLSDLTTSLDYPTLHEDAVETLRTLIASEKQIVTADGRWFSVRIIPYRRLDNMIDGVVITLFDITETKVLEAALRKESES
ncbi:two-component system CheB/CheR fusion protein [Natronocella acetinitrilica]|uniref:protein-glutamate O-methyltransferase n=1 Tax=Natronocella acetinitrilica TaxID=414046 RepID=A0AAE3G7B0_9GAMM|nr:chemotaxis protein CheB [Natronocella acetinitrilica]MCP1676757.1 two-component system CheB/CheR fusion protein [Natronocella acetinitrilica]